MQGIAPQGRPAHRPPAPQQRTGGARPPGPQPVHTALICVALPALAISGEHGQMTGQGLDGFYRGGRRILARCLVRVGGEPPLPVQGRMLAADRARFVGTVRTAADSGPDPAVTVERLRSAEGVERVVLRSTAGRPLRLRVEVSLGTDLAELGAVAAGVPGPEVPAAVHASGLRWTAPGAQAVVTAEPAPGDTLASAGLLCWEIDLPPGGTRAIELRAGLEQPGRVRPPETAASHGRGATLPWGDAEADGDDPRAAALFATALDDLRALLLRDPAQPGDVHLAAGVPWRCGLAPAEALWAARMTLPLGVRVAAGTLRTLARTQIAGTGPDRGSFPGALRHAGAHLPPGCTGIEATLLFPVVLAEARRWGLPERETLALLPAAERCLEWLWSAVAAGGTAAGGCLADPLPTGPYRCEVQAHAHRAALLGADLLEAHGRPGAERWRGWAAGLRSRFREEFWIEDPGGGRPAAARTPDGRLIPHLGSAAAHLLDTGLLGAGDHAPGLLDKVRTEQLARLLGGPALDSGWGLRSLGAKEPGHNPFGHRSGAVRVHETAVAVAGLAVAGYEKEAGGLLRGVIDAAESFGHRLPEMYAGEQRATGSAPLPHPAACRPAAVAAAGAVQLLTTLAGVRPDVPAGSVAVRPLRTAPLGALRFTGLRVAEQPFAVRISRLGLGMVEEAADGLQLGV
ncbi:glycogen debranching protein [Streptomyces albireticuli]|uniref:glycogen debranching N-terminal domain-containing protein n=1 Tax=Streptomyces albireticuli TaxID=1940 RepID=UPI001E5A6402|nr:glycogen debranching N-terminal domain-containing protein [Streptomyces albireticuli]MCD9145566.1 glycogen debranching protein [Streptomyces albireticuli]MCD9165144.1 glycogen debranching protein [Streptomyces albireticuli]MCD9195673.1 glycogen debranching protein [Streptomyces albireticuli]